MNSGEWKEWAAIDEPSNAELAADLRRAAEHFGGTLRASLLEAARRLERKGRSQ